MMRQLAFAARQHGFADELIQPQPSVNERQPRASGIAAASYSRCRWAAKANAAVVRFEPRIKDDRGGDHSSCTHQGQAATASRRQRAPVPARDFSEKASGRSIGSEHVEEELRQGPVASASRQTTTASVSTTA